MTEDLEAQIGETVENATSTLAVEPEVEVASALESVEATETPSEISVTDKVCRSSSTFPVYRTPLLTFIHQQIDLRVEAASGHEILSFESVLSEVSISQENQDNEDPFADPVEPIVRAQF